MESAEVEMGLLEGEIVDDQLTMKGVLPVEVHHTKTFFCILEVPFQKDVIELLRNLLTQNIDFVGCEQAVIHCWQYGEDLVKEYCQVLLSVLDRLYPNIETEFLPLSIKPLQALSFFLLTSAFFLHPALIDDFLQFLTLLLFDHIVKLYFLILSIPFHLFHQFLFYFSVKKLLYLLKLLRLLPNNQNLWLFLWWKEIHFLRSLSDMGRSGTVGVQLLSSSLFLQHLLVRVDNRA